MISKNQTLLFFKAIFLLLLLSSVPLFGQNNLIVNGDFESYSIYGQITAPSYTDYTRVNGAYVVEAGRYCIDNTTANHGGGLGFPNLTNSNGKFMLVNGWGGSNAPSKVVWKQTVNVTAQTNYTISYRVVNLNRVIFGQTATAKLQLKINGTNVGGVNSLPTGNNNWQNWSNTWNSGTNTQATIEIFDTYNGDAGIGDDFCLDDISFIPDVVYSVETVNDDASTCLDESVTVNVLANDVVLPNTNDATVTIVQNPAHGTATVLSDKRIQYTFTDGNFSGGTDQIKYRVTTHGIYDEAWLYVSTSAPPDVASIETPSAICAGGSLDISTPYVDDNGSTVTTSGWMKSTNANGPYSSFDPNNIPLSMNGNWVRYSATNGCGEGYSNAVQITVTNGPTIGATPDVVAICAGESLNLTAPQVTSNGLNITEQRWIARPTLDGDDNTSFDPNNVTAAYNGWYISYRVQSDCGYSYSAPFRQITVNVAPVITGTLQAPDAICAGSDLDVTAPAYDGNGTGTWEISQNTNGTFQNFSIQNVPLTYNNWYLRYKVSNDCGDDVSNYVQIHVHDAPSISAPDAPTSICAGESFSLTTPVIDANGSTITNQGWQIAATQNGNYTSFNNNNVPYAYNGYWIRYFAESECGDATSESVQITVNDEPVVGNITAPDGICAGEAFNLTTPNVEWRHVNQGTGTWQIQINGVWQTLDNNNIPFDYNGCNIRYKAENGCGTDYSSNNVQVTVYSTDIIDEGEITACDAIYHHGVFCNQTGLYVADSITPNGCTIQVTWNFTLGEAYIAPVQYEDACGSYYWPKTHRNYYESGVYDTIIISGNPLICDSTFTLDLTVNHAPEISGNLQAPNEICSTEVLGVNPPQYAMNHEGGGSTRWDYSTSANGPFIGFDPETYHFDYSAAPYYLRFAVVNGCDSTFSNVVQFYVNGDPIIDGELSAFQVCEGNPLDLPEVDVEWKNQNENDRFAEWQMATSQNGTYAGIDPSMVMQTSHNGCWIRYYVQTSCNDDILGPVQITVTSEQEEWLDPVSACDSYTLPSGEIITETQVVSDTLYDPCPHIIHQSIVINHSDHTEEFITSCQDEFVWHGTTFYRSEQTQYHTWDTTNVYGCDSIVELVLDFGDYSSKTEQKKACDTYYWPRNDSTYYYDESHPHIHDSLFIPGNGVVCDSIIFLSLDLGQSYEYEGEPMTECSGFVWHGVSYYDDAIIYDSLKTEVAHCDSIISHQLTIIQPVETSIEKTSCTPIWWQGHYFEEDGDQYTATLESTVTGCDSIVTMYFNLADQIVNEFDTVACEPFTWFEFECNQSGMTCQHPFVTNDGCDSLVIMHVEMTETVELSTQFVAACDYYEYNGVVYDEPGETIIPLDTILNQYGCDSIIRRIRLEIKDSELIGLIHGSSNVYVATNLISGIYRYEINPEEIQGNVTWTISNPDWQIVEAQDNYCLVFVGTTGSATLTANFRTPECGVIDRSFDINAGFFGVDDHDYFEVNVFPNPTRGTVTIEAQGIESIRLTNMMGQVMEVRKCDRSDNLILDLSDYAPSVYLLEIKTVNGSANKRVTVCR